MVNRYAVRSIRGDEQAARRLIIHPPVCHGTEFREDPFRGVAFMRLTFLRLPPRFSHLMPRLGQQVAGGSSCRCRGVPPAHDNQPSA